MIKIKKNKNLIIYITLAIVVMAIVYFVFIDKTQEGKSFKNYKPDSASDYAY